MNFNIKFKNTYSKLPRHFYQMIHPETKKNPQLRFWNTELAQSLAIMDKPHSLKMAQDLAAVFSGNQVLPSSQPLAMAYSGHQFGQFNPGLGDGRAHLLGELPDTHGQLFDIQLKGSGRTPFSRSGDGKCPLGPAIRESILSESLYHLGVPTTRCLAVVSTEDVAFREKPLPTAVLTRVAQTHIRVGHFEHFASRDDTQALDTLLKFIVERAYPELVNSNTLSLNFFKSLLRKQAELVARWMSLGFIHGVMNTDNTSAAGLTIDYGPCAFMDDTDFNKVYSSIDRHSRYAYAQQPAITKWNLTRLAECLLKLDTQTSIDTYQSELNNFEPIYNSVWEELMLKKLGFKNITQEALSCLTLWLRIIQTHQYDFTLSFRNLSGLIEQETGQFFKTDQEFINFTKTWKPLILKEHESRKKASEFLNSQNPILIPRNHIVEKTIQDCEQGDYQLFDKIHKALKSPFIEAEELESLYRRPQDGEQIKNTFCGT